MTDHLKGLLITALGVLCLVPDSMFVRLIAEDGVTIAFWRNLFAGSFILAFLLVTQGAGQVRQVLKTGRPGLAYVVLFGTSSTGFVLAVTLTSVANVVFIIAAMPVFAAIMSRIFLGEIISQRMIWTIAGVLLGMVIILFGSQKTANASWQGDLVAVGVAFCFAAALTALRQLRGQPTLALVPAALLGSALVLWPFVNVLASFALHWPLFLMHGAFITFAAALMALGPRYLTSAEVSLLILLESILAPVLVWVWLEEYPGSLTLVGGAVLIAVLLVSNLVVLWSFRRKRAVMPIVR